MLRDPLGEVTRRERRMLLGVSILSIFIAQTGLIPEKISALGVELARTNQRAFLSIMVFVVSYFVVAFVVYGVSDLLAWRLSYNEGVKAIDQTRIDRIDQNTRELKKSQGLEHHIRGLIFGSCALLYRFLVFVPRLSSYYRWQLVVMQSMFLWFFVARSNG